MNIACQLLAACLGMLPHGGCAHGVLPPPPFVVPETVAGLEALPICPDLPIPQMGSFWDNRCDSPPRDICTLSSRALIRVEMAARPPDGAYLAVFVDNAPFHFSCYRVECDPPRVVFLQPIPAGRHNVKMWYIREFCRSLVVSQDIVVTAPEPVKIEGVYEVKQKHPEWMAIPPDRRVDIYGNRFRVRISGLQPNEIGFAYVNDERLVSHCCQDKEQKEKAKKQFKEDLDAAAKRVEDARTNLRKAKDELQNANDMTKGAGKALAAAEANLKEPQSALQPAQAKVKEAENNLKKAQEDLTAKEQNLRKPAEKPDAKGGKVPDPTQLKADFDKAVEDVTKRSGELVAAQGNLAEAQRTLAKVQALRDAAQILFNTGVADKNHKVDQAQNQLDDAWDILKKLIDGNASGAVLVPDCSRLASVEMEINACPLVPNREYKLEIRVVRRDGTPDRSEAVWVNYAACRPMMSFKLSDIQGCDTNCACKCNGVAFTRVDAGEWLAPPCPEQMACESRTPVQKPCQAAPTYTDPCPPSAGKPQPCPKKEDKPMDKAKCNQGGAEESAADDLLPKYVPQAQPSGKQPSDTPDCCKNCCFTIPQAARFSVRFFGPNGELVPEQGVVIYEGMQLRIWDGGCYEIAFTASMPTMPVTLRLQLVFIHDDDESCCTVLTLPPIALDPKQPRYGNYIGSSTLIRQQGCFAKLGDICQNADQYRLVRQGTARFGSYPYPPGQPLYGGGTGH